MRLWSYQAIARGAERINYFVWRSPRIGAGRYWHGVLDNHGEPGRRYDELARPTAEAPATKIKGTATPASSA